MNTNVIFELEKQMWDAAISGNKAGFSETAAPNAVMVCGGYRCSGAEYAELITNFGL